METKYAIITGASSGVGSAVAKDRARLGYAIGLVVRNRQKGQKIMQQITQ